MIIHLFLRRHVPRQISGVPSPTTVAGVTNSAMIQTAVAPDSAGLSFDTSTHSAPAATTAPQLAPVTTPSQMSTSPISSPTPSAASNSSSPIPMGTVIGSCVGALIGTVALILLGVWLYRRYSKSLNKRSGPRGPVSHTRNTYAEQSRSRSRSEPWRKLEDQDDKWEGMYQTKEIDHTDNVAPMEKLTMFKKSPSVRTAYTHKSEEPVTFDIQAFAPYHPHLAAELASAGMPVPRPFLGRADPANPISWDGETLGKDSLHSGFSLRSNRMEGGAMSPTLNMAIPTPPAISSEPHLWQSAEVVVVDEQSADVADNENPFGEGSHRRKSFNNPFFKGREVSTNAVTRSTSAGRTGFKPSKDKEPLADDNPFSDDNELAFPKPFVHHVNNSSLTSVSSADRAMQSLIAALDISEEEVQERLRVASMQPSFVSNASVYTNGEEEDVTQAFPLPPSTAGRPIYKQ